MQIQFTFDVPDKWENYPQGYYELLLAYLKRSGHEPLYMRMGKDL
jgi:hypothetical protein